jgi:hypothetical protein
MPGRYREVSFSEFTYTGVISAYESQALGLLLLSGKKADVLSFCATSAESTVVQIDTIEIDMNALQELLPSVNLVWFSFPAGMIRASALMGANVERTDAFVRSRSEGAITTLSFYFEDDGGSKHPVMVVSDGTVVLQGTYPETGTELQLVMEVYEGLLHGICSRVTPRLPRKRAATSEELT